MQPVTSKARPAHQQTALRTRLGVLTLLLLGTVQFLDIIDSSIVNVALPSIQHALHFSQQNLQWVASGYLLTFGGFLLLGGRLSDLLGRRPMLVAGVSIFGLASLGGALADSQGVLIGARIVQGTGAALMAPAALSTLVTTFREGADRNTALGAWGAISGLAAAAGVFLGGVLSEGPGWRWILLVNPPVCLLVLAAAFWLLPRQSRRQRPASFDTQGAVLVTAGMLLLVYALVQAPSAGWGATRTILLLSGAAVLLAAFVVNELRSSNPLIPFPILRTRGLAAAAATQLLAFAGVFAMLFFITLYMQEILHYPPVKAGAAYLPITAGFGLSGAISPRLIARIGTRPVTVFGALLGAAGVYQLARVPLHGTYPGDVLPGMLVMALGMGGVFVAVTTAASTGVPGDQAGLAAGLLNASQQLGSALGLAILSAIAIARTTSLLAAHTTRLTALAAGYHRGLVAGSVFMLGAAIAALRTRNTRAAAQLVLAPSDNAPQPAGSS